MLEGFFISFIPTSSLPSKFYDYTLSALVYLSFIVVPCRLLPLISLLFV